MVLQRRRNKRKLLPGRARATTVLQPPGRCCIRYHWLESGLLEPYYLDRYWPRDIRFKWKLANVNTRKLLSSLLKCALVHCHLDSALICFRDTCNISRYQRQVSLWSLRPRDDLHHQCYHSNCNSRWLRRRLIFVRGLQYPHWPHCRLRGRDSSWPRSNWHSYLDVAQAPSGSSSPLQDHTRRW